MDKYYTPEIKEFHVGFECELIDNDKTHKWFPIKCREETLYDVQSSHYNARVKYLDKEDIESLGFELDQKTKDGYCFIYGNMIDGDYMLWTEDFKKIELFNMMGTKNEVSFEGTIKNKSELIKLLKQLGIG
jgi:hypothetical protein